MKVGEGLVGAFAPVASVARKPAKRKPAKANGPLISAEAIRGLRLEDEGNDLVGEVPLGRPLYGAEELEVSVNVEGVSEAQAEVSLSKSQIKKTVQETLARLESLLPLIHEKLLTERGPYAPTPEAFVETLHSPALAFVSDELAAGRWSFVVEGAVVGFHLEFEGDRLLDVFAGD